MPLARFKSEPHRQEFVRNLLARGFKQVGPRPGLRRLPYATFRVYEYFDSHCKKPQLRVSYYESQTGPILPIPKAMDSQPPMSVPCCTTPGHSDRKALSRGLCSNCYQRWYYWNRAEFRKKKRMASLNRKRKAMKEAA